MCATHKNGGVGFLQSIIISTILLLLCFEENQCILFVSSHVVGMLRFNQLSFPTPVILFLGLFLVFMALSTVFHSRKKETEN